MEDQVLHKLIRASGAAMRHSHR